MLRTAEQKAESLPWFIPRLEDKLTVLLPAGAKSIKIKKGVVVIAEDEYMDKMVYVKNGLLMQSAINYKLKKPFSTLSLCLPGRLTGRMMFLSKYSAPVRVTALRNSELVTLSFSSIKKLLEKEFELYQVFTDYCARCDRSEFGGISAVGTMDAEERLKLFLMASIRASRANATAEWVRLPFMLTRNELSDILYVTRLTIDRVLTQWSRDRVYKHEESEFYIHRTLLDSTAL